ncbi:MAG: amino acid ABC transporter substrate-binding protein, partial [Arenicella sp.]
MIKKISLVTIGVAGAALSMTANAGTLDDVKARGALSCGVSTGLAGFSQKDE